MLLFTKFIFHLIGSLHHTQYCEKLQNIVEFAGVKISLEELSTIWNMQTGKHITIIDNIHGILSSATSNFSTDQMEHFISLLEKVKHKKCGFCAFRSLIIIRSYIILNKSLISGNSCRCL